MMRAVGFVMLMALAMSYGSSNPASADEQSSYRKHSGARVKGYTERRGGYSYSVPDTINTYGDSRSLYGSTRAFRDPSMDTQTNAGPFDHGFFFDSGIAPRGGDSPYMN